MKRSLVFMIWLLPVLLLAGWLAYEQLPRFIWPAPAWLDPANPSAVAGTCEVRNSLALMGGRFVSETPSLAVSESEAQARAIIAETYSPAPENPTVNSTVVGANFPNTGERLAWLHVIGVSAAGENQPGKAAIVYLDASTGELLSLITAGAANLPTPLCGAPTGRRALLRQFAPLVGIAGYLGLSVVAWGIVRVARRPHPPTPSPL